MSPELFVLVVSVLAGVVLVATGWWLGRRPVTVEPPAPAPLVEQPPPPVPVAVPAATLPKPRGDPLTIHLLSAQGRSLGTTVIDRRMRRPTLQFRPRRAKTTSTFVAVQPTPGGFIYREVGRERE